MPLEDLLELERAERVQMTMIAQAEAEVADPVDDERLLGRARRPRASCTRSR